MKFSSLAFASLFLFAFAAASCTQEAQNTLKSPVQGVMTLLEQSDGTVEADLVLISTEVNPHEFIESAENATLRVPGGAKIALEQSTPGHYTASSKDEPDLEYVGNESYKFSFDLPDKVEEQNVEPGYYVAVIEAPTDKAEFTLDKQPEFTGDTAKITWTPKAQFAVINVQGPAGETTYSTFDFSDPQFDGDKWARLGANGSFTVPASAFKDAGSYTVSMCGVTKKSGLDAELSEDLGVLSGFLAGHCVEPVEFDLED